MDLEDFSGFHVLRSSLQPVVILEGGSFLKFKALWKDIVTGMLFPVE